MARRRVAKSDAYIFPYGSAYGTCWDSDFVLFPHSTKHCIHVQNSEQTSWKSVDVGVPRYMLRKARLLLGHDATDDGVLEFALRNSDQPDAFWASESDLFRMSMNELQDKNDTVPSSSVGPLSLAEPAVEKKVVSRPGSFHHPASPALDRQMASFRVSSDALQQPMTSEAGPDGKVNDPLSKVVALMASDSRMRVFREAALDEAQGEGRGKDVHSRARSSGDDMGHCESTAPHIASDAQGPGPRPEQPRERQRESWVADLVPDDLVEVDIGASCAQGYLSAHTMRLCSGLSPLDDSGLTLGACPSCQEELSGAREYGAPPGIFWCPVCLLCGNCARDRPVCRQADDGVSASVAKALPGSVEELWPSVPEEAPASLPTGSTGPSSAPGGGGAGALTAAAPEVSSGASGATGGTAARGSASPAVGFVFGAPATSFEGSDGAVAAGGGLGAPAGGGFVFGAPATSSGGSEEGGGGSVAAGGGSLLPPPGASDGATTPSPTHGQRRPRRGRAGRGRYGVKRRAGDQPTAVDSEASAAPEAPAKRCVWPEVWVPARVVHVAVTKAEKDPFKAKDCANSSPLERREIKVQVLCADDIPDSYQGPRQFGGCREGRAGHLVLRKHLTSCLAPLGTKHSGGWIAGLCSGDEVAVRAEVEIKRFVLVPGECQRLKTDRADGGDALLPMAQVLSHITGIEVASGA